jgi:hypothetical protein
MRECTINLDLYDYYNVRRYDPSYDLYAGRRESDYDYGRAILAKISDATLISQSNALMTEDLLRAQECPQL